MLGVKGVSWKSNPKGHQLCGYCISSRYFAKFTYTLFQDHFSYNIKEKN